MVILIGNGTSVLDSEKGSYINQFDRVVRFNSFKIKGFEKFIGSKTTDWFNTKLFPDNDFRLHMSYYRYVFHSWEWNKKDQSHYLMSSKVMADINTTTTKETLNEMKEFLGEKYQWFSTGAIATWIFLKEVPKVYLYGFDWWEREKHHYGDNEIRGLVHQPAYEKLFFEKLGDKVQFI